MTPAHPTDFLPLKPRIYHMLLVLAENDCHAYALKKEVQRRSDGSIRLGPGTLQRSLAELEGHGLIEESHARPAPHLDDARRRYYRITPLGRRVAAAETDRIARLVEMARASIGAGQ